MNDNEILGSMAPYDSIEDYYFWMWVLSYD